MELLIPVAAIAINLIILFFVIRKASRADEQVALLKQILDGQKPKEKSAITQMAEEMKQKKDEALRDGFERMWIREGFHKHYAADSEFKAKYWETWKLNHG